MTMRTIAAHPPPGHVPPAMITGNQIAAARRLAGISSQAALADAAGVSRPTVERAEAARDAVPAMRTDQFVRIVRALEEAGVEFILPQGASLVGGVSIRMRSKA